MPRTGTFMFFFTSWNAHCPYENNANSLNEHNIATGEKVRQEQATIALKMMGQEVVLRKNEKLTGKI